MFGELLDDGNERQLLAIRLARAHERRLELLFLSSQRTFNLPDPRLGGFCGAPGLRLDHSRVVHRFAGSFLLLLGLDNLRLELHLRLRQFLAERVAFAARGGSGVLRRPSFLRVARPALRREVHLASPGRLESLFRRG